MDQYKHSAGGEQPSPSGVLIDRTSAGYNSTTVVHRRSCTLIRTVTPCHKPKFSFGCSSAVVIVSTDEIPQPRHPPLIVTTVTSCGHRNSNAASAGKCDSPHSPKKYSGYIKRGVGAAVYEVLWQLVKN